MIKEPNFIRSLLFEIPAILIAVLLALVLSSWRENVNKNEKARIIIAYVTAEIENNYAVIRLVDSLSQSSLNAFNASILSYETGKSQDIPSALVTPTIKNVAWEMARSSEVFSNIAPEVITNMASVYQEQERAAAIIKSLDDFRIKQDPGMSLINSAKYKRNHLRGLIDRYRDLKRRYEEFLLD